MSYDKKTASSESTNYPACSTEIFPHLSGHFVYQAFSFNTQSSVVIRASCHQAGVGKIHGRHSSVICNMIGGTALFCLLRGTKDIGSIYRLQGVPARFWLTFVHRTQHSQPFKLSTPTLLLLLHRVGIIPAPSISSKTKLRLLQIDQPFQCGTSSLCFSSFERLLEVFRLFRVHGF